MTVRSTSSASAIRYPRTGKRGLPQQFPRRLYEMLESESNVHSDPNNAFQPSLRKVIQWSESGRAFQITDVSLFSNQILPKYFRTSKFSSFQRNLNLYGFSKVRRGPDTDMYAHPSFVRGCPEALSQLRKCTSSKERPHDHKLVVSSDGKVTSCSRNPRELETSFKRSSLTNSVASVTLQDSQDIGNSSRHMKTSYHLQYLDLPCNPSNNMSAHPVNIRWEGQNVVAEATCSTLKNPCQKKNDPIQHNGNSKLALLAMALKILGD